MKLKNSPHFSLPAFPTILVTLISFILLSVLFITVHAYAASDTKPVVGKHLVTIHDADVTEGIMTTDSTLRQVFKDAGIPITDRDLVEPGLDTQLIAADYQVNVYRARPITIVDGNVHKRVMSPYRTGDQIATHAGMTLHEEDTTTMTPNRDIIASGAGLTLTIDRATPFTLYLYGKKVAAYTQATTVGDMLDEKGVKLGPKDDTSKPLDTKVIAGMTVKVWRNGVQTVTNKETIHFHVKKIQDNDKPVGYKKIQTPGKNGQKMVTYQVTMHNGETVKKKQIQSVVTKHATEQIEVIGTKPSFSGDFAAALAKLRSCEGGYTSVNNRASNPANWYYGAYQFDDGTWGGYKGYAHASDAPPGIQDEAAHQLYLRRGWSPWPVCGAPLPDTYR